MGVRAIAVGVAAAVLVWAQGAAAAEDPRAELERLYRVWREGLRLELRMPERPTLGSPPALPALKVPELSLPESVPRVDPEALRAALPPLPELPELRGPGLVAQHFGDWSNVQAGLRELLPDPVLPTKVPGPASFELPSLRVPELVRLRPPALDALPWPKPRPEPVRDLTGLARALRLTPGERALLDPARTEWAQTFAQRVRALDATLEAFEVPAARFPAPPTRKGVDLSAAFARAGEPLKARVGAWKEQLWERARALLHLQAVHPPRRPADLRGGQGAER